MVSPMSKEYWSKDIEEDLILLIKDWLKQTGRTQSELCQILNLPSARMQTLIESLKKDFLKAFDEQLDKGEFIGGSSVQNFESNFSRFEINL